VKYNTPIAVMGGKAGGKGKGKEKEKEKEKEATSQTEDILNSILPPREWTEDGQLWIQYVSSTPATRLDVVNLQERLDHALQSRQARETGICPVREELYAQCFGTCACWVADCIWRRGGVGAELASYIRHDCLSNRPNPSPGNGSTLTLHPTATIPHPHTPRRADSSNHHQLR